MFARSCSWISSRGFQQRFLRRRVFATVAVNSIRHEGDIDMHSWIDRQRAPSTSVVLFAPRAHELGALVQKLDGSVVTWVLVLKEIDAVAKELKQRLESQSGEECLLIQADFHDPDDRLQALAMAEDFAGQLTFIMDGTAWRQ